MSATQSTTRLAVASTAPLATDNPPESTARQSGCDHPRGTTWTLRTSLENNGTPAMHMSRLAVSRGILLAALLAPGANTVAEGSRLRAERVKVLGVTRLDTVTDRAITGTRVVAALCRGSA